MAERFTNAVHQLSRGLHYVAGSIMVGMMLMIVANILGRTWFNFGVRGTVELTQLAMVGLVFLGLSYAQTRDDHVTMDLLYVKLPRLGRAILDVFAAVVTITIVSLIAWQLVGHHDQLEAAGRVTNTLRLPMHPFVWVAVVGSAFFALAVLATAIDWARGRSTTEDADQGDPETGGY